MLPLCLFQKVEFIKEYWNEVFVPFVDAYKTGFYTPNPDVGCNRVIKFLKCKEYVQNVLGIKLMATGHYAQLHRTSTGAPVLTCGKDLHKDQSYFLSTTRVWLSLLSTISFLSLHVMCLPGALYCTNMTNMTGFIF